MEEKASKIPSGTLASVSANTRFNSSDKNIGGSRPSKFRLQQKLGVSTSLNSVRPAHYGLAVAK
jgi:hypothetical protein